MRIEPLDLRTAPEAEVRAVYDVIAANQVEAAPGWEPDSWSDFLGTARHPVPWRPYLWWVARADAGRIVGSAAYIAEERSTNRDKCEVYVDVEGAARRRGLGRALLRVAAEQAMSDGRTTLGSACSEAPGPLAFVEAVGMEPKLRERRSGVRLAAVDRAMLDKWATPVPGYEVVAWDGPCPAELVDRFAEAHAIMNTQPFDDFDLDPEVLTPDELGELEAGRLATGTEWATIAVLDVRTGEVAGYTDMQFRPDRGVAEQGDTGVAVAHRNQGLGRLLKAVMLLRVLDQRPSVTAVETWNAGSNAPMLRINTELGFETVEWTWNVQGPTSEVLARTQP